MKADETLERAKFEFRVKNDSRLSKQLGITRAAISSWRKRDTVSYETIFWACQEQNKDFNYIITGENTSEQLRLLSAYKTVMRGVSQQKDLWNPIKAYLPEEARTISKDLGLHVMMRGHHGPSL